MNDAIFQIVFWLVQALLAIIGAGFVMWLKYIQGQVAELRAAKHQQASELSALKILVAGDYLKREEFKDFMREMTSEVRGGFNDMHKKMDSGFSELYDEVKRKADKV